MMLVFAFVLVWVNHRLTRRIIPIRERRIDSWCQNMQSKAAITADAKLTKNSHAANEHEHFTVGRIHFEIGCCVCVRCEYSKHIRIERNEIVFGEYISCIMKTVKEKAANYSLPLVILYHLLCLPICLRCIDKSVSLHLNWWIPCNVKRMLTNGVVSNEQLIDELLHYRWIGSCSTEKY